MNYNPSEISLWASIEALYEEAEYYLGEVIGKLRQKNDALDAEFKRKGTYTQLPASEDLRAKVGQMLADFRDSVALIEVEIRRLEE